jgi:hypothetical protein
VVSLLVAYRSTCGHGDPPSDEQPWKRLAGDFESELRHTQSGIAGNRLAKTMRAPHTHSGRGPSPCEHADGAYKEHVQDVRGHECAFECWT